MQKICQISGFRSTKGLISFHWLSYNHDPYFAVDMDYAVDGKSASVPGSVPHMLDIMPAYLPAYLKLFMNL